MILFLFFTLYQLMKEITLMYYLLLNHPPWYHVSSFVSHHLPLFLHFGSFHKYPSNLTRLAVVLFSRQVVSDSVTPWTAACQVPLSFTISQGLLKLMFIELMMPSNYLILCHPLFLLPSIFPTIRVFSSESAVCIMTKFL